jgi:hypothetical protein
MSELVFRGLRGRTFEDQKQAIVDGYGSVAEMAIDELGTLLLSTMRRVDALEHQMRSAGFWTHAGEVDDGG